MLHLTFINCILFIFPQLWSPNVLEKTIFVEGILRVNKYS